MFVFFVVCNVLVGLGFADMVRRWVNEDVTE